MNTITLKKNKDKPARAFHPWIFSGAIAKVDPAIDPGEIIQVNDNEGLFLAYGYYNPKSSIAIRLFEWGYVADPVQSLIRNIATAIARRESVLNIQNDSCRLIFSEGDRVPGLIVDKFADCLVIQILTLGMDKLRNEIVAVLLRHFPETCCLVERSDGSIRSKEGLSPLAQILYGTLDSDLVLSRQNGIELWVDVQKGHKTGFYLDQTANLDFLAKHAKDKKILDCFCYTGAFSIACAKAGAQSVLGLDSSENALELAYKNAKQNEMNGKCLFKKANVFEHLRSLQHDDTGFDLIILDPPKLADSSNNINKAARAYKDLNLSAFRSLQKRGLLATFSCSAHVDEQLFQKIVWQACTDAGKQARIIAHLSQAQDHPVLLSFPQGKYLKGLLLEVI